MEFPSFQKIRKFLPVLVQSLAVLEKFQSKIRSCIYGATILNLSRQKLAACISYHFQVHFVSIMPHEHWVMVRITVPVLFP